MNGRTVRLSPEFTPGNVDTSQVARDAQIAINRKASPIPPFPAFAVVNTDVLALHTYRVQDADQTLALTGSLAATIAFSQASLSANRLLRLLLRNTSGLPTLQAVGTDTIEALPTGATSAVYQSDGKTAGTWFLVDYTAVVAPVTPLLGLKAGYRWPTAAQNITLTNNDFSIYGTAGQHCNNVTFPLASSLPGQYYIFTYPPGGSLIASGGDTIDAYAGQTAAYQSDGVSAWRRMWNV